MKTRISLAIASLASMVAFGCAVQKTRLERDIEQCTYGAVVPHNFDSDAERKAYIQNVSVPACLRAKGYTDVEGDR